jgi:RNA polymerase sigma-70 factor, ECF subfamily
MRAATPTALRLAELARADHEVDVELTSDQLFRAHARFVASLAYRLLGRSDEVDDLVQDVFLAAQRSLASLRAKDAARAWLATITVRKARRRLRVRRLWMTIGLDRDDGSELAVTSHEAGPYTMTLIAELFARLDRIPTDQRIAWTLRYLQNEQLDVVAARCGCSLATVKRRIEAVSAQLEAEEPRR